jgi:hypothetical protein
VSDDIVPDKRQRLKLVGHLRLTPRQRRMWLTMVGEVPGGVTTVECLRQWVEARRLRLASAPHADECDDRAAVLDALFAWTTGRELANGHDDDTPATPSPLRSKGGLTYHAGGRIALERELLGLVLADHGDSDRARELGNLLDRRTAPKAAQPPQN